MIVLGMVLVLVGIVVVLAAIFAGSAAPATLELGFLSIDTSVLGVFLVGAATLLVLVAGLELVRTGARRSYARRKELREARRMVRRRERRDHHEDHPPPQEAPERGETSEPPRTS